MSTNPVNIRSFDFMHSIEQTVKFAYYKHIICSFVHFAQSDDIWTSKWDNICIYKRAMNE